MGLDNDAENPVTAELRRWADIAFVMERAQWRKLAAKFKPYLGRARIIYLEIPGNYEFMAPELVELLIAKIPRYLP